MTRTGIIAGGEPEICKYFIGKSKECENTNVYEAKAWLLTGRSLLPKNFSIQLESFLLEKRQKNVDGCARCFEMLFRDFPMEIMEEVNEMVNAVKTVALSSGKETETEAFLGDVFNSLPGQTRMNILMHRSEQTPVLLEKCQSVLLIVKLFPDVVNTHGGNMLYTLSGCEADVHSPFRSNLVTELVPAVLRLCKNLQPSPSLIILLNQCIEYYVMVDESEGKEESTLEVDSRWEKLYVIVDQVGALLGWSLVPFFRDTPSTSGSSNNIESLFKALSLAVQHRNHYTPIELAYIAVVIFLRCITSYYEKLTITNQWKTDKSKLALVEVFLPGLKNAVPDPNLPVITTITPCSSVTSDSSQLLQYFITAAKTWQLVHSPGADRLNKEFFHILSSMKSLNLDQWQIFTDFQFDYATYTGSHAKTSKCISLVKLASMYCSLGNFQAASEYAIEAVSEAISAHQTSPISSPTAETRPMSRSRSVSGSAPPLPKPPVSFSFYNCNEYEKDRAGYLVPQRRVHFISENKSEVLAYAVNVLIQCFYSYVNLPANRENDLCLGHLMTLLQAEWYSPPADMMLTQIFEVIKRKGSFTYHPFFSEFVIEADILEQFMGIYSNEKVDGKTALNIFAPTGATSSRRIGTRGVDRGQKNNFAYNMKKQIFKNVRENLETLIVLFLTGYNSEIISCFKS